MRGSANPDDVIHLAALIPVYTGTWSELSVNKIRQGLIGNSWLRTLFDELSNEQLGNDQTDQIGRKLTKVTELLKTHKGNKADSIFEGLGANIDDIDGARKLYDGYVAKQTELMSDNLLPLVPMLAKQVLATINRISDAKNHLQHSKMEFYEDHRESINVLFDFLSKVHEQCGQLAQYRQPSLDTWDSSRQKQEPQR